MDPQHPHRFVPGILYDMRGSVLVFLPQNRLNIKALKKSGTIKFRVVFVNEFTPMTFKMPMFYALRKILGEPIRTLEIVSL